MHEQTGPFIIPREAAGRPVKSKTCALPITVRCVTVIDILRYESFGWQNMNVTAEHLLATLESR